MTQKNLISCLLACCAVGKFFMCVHLLFSLQRVVNAIEEAEEEKEDLCC